MSHYQYVCSLLSSAILRFLNLYQSVLQYLLLRANIKAVHLITVIFSERYNIKLINLGGCFTFFIRDLFAAYYVLLLYSNICQYLSVGLLLLFLFINSIYTLLFIFLIQFILFLSRKLLYFLYNLISWALTLI